MVKRTVVLVVALVLAGVAAFANWRFLRGVEEDNAGKFQLVQVFRATRSIPSGTMGEDLVSQNLFVQSQEQREFLPGLSSRDGQSASTAFQTSTSLEEFLTGKVAAGPIAQNEILSSEQWVAPDQIELKSLSELLPEGKQAMSVQVDQTKGVGGFVLPGDRVNVVVTITAPRLDPSLLGEGSLTSDNLRELVSLLQQSQASELSRFLLQGVEVLAVGNIVNTESGPTAAGASQLLAPRPTAGEEPAPSSETPAANTIENANIYTLGVTAQDAERLAYAFERGSVWLTLVSPEFQPTATEGISRENLFE